MWWRRIRYWIYWLWSDTAEPPEVSHYGLAAVRFQQVLHQLDGERVLDWSELEDRVVAVRAPGLGARGVWVRGVRDAKTGWSIPQISVDLHLYILINLLILPASDHYWRQDGPSLSLRTVLILGIFVRFALVLQILYAELTKYFLAIVTFTDVHRYPTANNARYHLFEFFEGARHLTLGGIEVLLLSVFNFFFELRLRNEKWKARRPRQILSVFVHKSQWI